MVVKGNTLNHGYVWCIGAWNRNWMSFIACDVCITEAEWCQILPHYPFILWFGGALLWITQFSPETEIDHLKYLILSKCEKGATKTFNKFGYKSALFLQKLTIVAWYLFVLLIQHGRIQTSCYSAWWDYFMFKTIQSFWSYWNIVQLMKPLHITQMIWWMLTTKGV